MITTADFLKQFHFFKPEKNRVFAQEEIVKHPQEKVDVNRLELLVCLEALIVVCYQSIAGLVHNQTVRKECQQFEQRAQTRQDQLKKIFTLSVKSEAAIEEKISKFLLQMKLSSLSLRAVLNLATNLTVLKIDIYKYVSRLDQEHHVLLSYFLENSIEEADFFRQEKKFHQNRMDVYLKT